MHVRLEIDERQLRKLVLDHFREKLQGNLDEKKVQIQVKSAQNYKADWETAHFRAVYEGDV